MKVAVVGKIGSMIHWLEDCVAALRADGHEVLVGVTRNPRVNHRIEEVLLSERLGAPMAALIARRIEKFAPRLILLIGAYEIPPIVIEKLANARGRPNLHAWIGDVFDAAAAPLAARFDAVAYTDTGLVERHARLGFSSPALYLPHAANTQPGGRWRWRGERRKRMVFVANPTPHRRAVVEAVRPPLAIHGPAWTPTARHEIHVGKVGRKALSDLYAGHFAALNIRNEHNVLHGLNQRNFDPYVFGTPVVTDAQPDLAAAFDEGEEVFVWRDASELEGLYERLLRAPAEAAAVGERGRRRVMAEHTYGRRLATLAALA